jgi:hypothetical protein
MIISVSSLILLIPVCLIEVGAVCIGEDDHRSGKISEVLVFSFTFLESPRHTPYVLLKTILRQYIGLLMILMGTGRQR